jgi:hypothetical protein
VQFTNGVKDAAIAVRDVLGGAMKAVGIGEKKENPIADRLPQLLTAIALTIKKANHTGLLYKFKLD